MTIKEVEAKAKQAGYSIRRLAREIGTTHTCVWNWFRGVHIPRPMYIVRMANVIGVSIEDLMVAFGQAETRDIKSK